MLVLDIPADEPSSAAFLCACCVPRVPASKHSICSSDSASFVARRDVADCAGMAKYFRTIGSLQGNNYMPLIDVLNERAQTVGLSSMHGAAPVANGCRVPGLLK